MTSPALLTAAAVSTPHAMWVMCLPCSQGRGCFSDAAGAAEPPPPLQLLLPLLQLPLLLLLLLLGVLGCACAASSRPAAPPHMNTCPEVLSAMEPAAAATRTQRGSPGTSVG
jgi:hypothetical protein